jgi:hypothetical protein
MMIEVVRTPSYGAAVRRPHETALHHEPLQSKRTRTPARQTARARAVNARPLAWTWGKPEGLLGAFRKRRGIPPPPIAGPGKRTDRRTYLYEGLKKQSFLKPPILRKDAHNENFRLCRKLLPLG